jgi:hypothetical protein
MIHRNINPLAPQRALLAFPPPNPVEALWKQAERIESVAEGQHEHVPAGRSLRRGATVQVYDERGRVVETAQIRYSSRRQALRCSCAELASHASCSETHAAKDSFEP